MAKCHSLPIFTKSLLTANATNVSSVMRIPFKLLYSILPISGVFIILARALKYVQLFAERKEKKGENA